MVVKYAFVCTSFGMRCCPVPIVASPLTPPSPSCVCSDGVLPRHGRPDVLYRSWRPNFAVTCKVCDEEAEIAHIVNICWTRTLTATCLVCDEEAEIHCR